MLKKYNTLIDLFSDQKNKPGRINFIDVNSNEESITFAEFWRNATFCLGHLQSKGIKPGEELVICTKSNMKFLTTFWAAILGGIIPVPLAVGISNEHRNKILKIITSLKNPNLVTDAKVKERLKIFIDTDEPNFDNKYIIDNAIIDYSHTAKGDLFPAKVDDIAFVQYSSGSTSDPKGVVLTHQNLTSNIYAIGEGLNLQIDDVGLSWMPLTHDMGLIGTHMTLFSAGLEHHIMDTDLFIRRPLLWLTKTNEYRASILTSPNFGYKHFLKAFKRKSLEKLDLSCVRLLINGAESISVTICNEFLVAMKEFNLSASAMFPVYGLAEATLGVSFPEAGKHFEFVNLDRRSLNIGAQCEQSLIKNDTNSISFVKHGSAIRDCNYKITDNENNELPSEYIGNIKIKGLNVTQSIYQDAKKTIALKENDGWVDTGDCGVIIDNQLIITGRKKEIVIVNGQNFYPQDIENIIIRGGNFDLGKIVASGAINNLTGIDELLVFVLYKSDLSTFRKIADQIRRIVSQEIGLEIDHVIPVKKIPKTTSGKLQRLSLAHQYMRGDFDELLIDKLSKSPIDTKDISDDVLKQLIIITNEHAKEFTIKSDDNLFEVGISSLTLTEIMMAIEEIYPSIVDIEDVFEHPDLNKLSSFIKNKIKNN